MNNPQGQLIDELDTTEHDMYADKLEAYYNRAVSRYPTVDTTFTIIALLEREREIFEEALLSHGVSASDIYKMLEESKGDIL